MNDTVSAERVRTIMPDALPFSVPDESANREHCIDRISRLSISKSVASFGVLLVEQGRVPCWAWVFADEEGTLIFEWSEDGREIEMRITPEEPEGEDAMKPLMPQIGPAMSEGYCRKCGQPLDISGKCDGCAVEGEEMAKQVRNFYTMEQDPDGVLWAFGKGSTFGGPSDPMDSGNTASGFSTKDHPHARYCALPEAVMSHYGIPFFAKCTFENLETGHQTHAAVVDYGPAGWTKRQFDLGPDVMISLGIDTDVRCKFYVAPNTLWDPVTNSEKT